MTFSAPTPTRVPGPTAITATAPTMTFETGAEPFVGEVYVPPPQESEPVSGYPRVRRRRRIYPVQEIGPWLALRITTDVGFESGIGVQYVGPTLQIAVEQEWNYQPVIETGPRLAVFVEQQRGRIVTLPDAREAGPILGLQVEQETQYWNAFDLDAEDVADLYLTGAI